MVKKNKKKVALSKSTTTLKEYDVILSGITALLESARKTSARTVNAIMTITYWEIGRRIVEYEQGGKGRAAYGEQLIEQIVIDFKKHFGWWVGRSNLRQMRSFYLEWSDKHNSPDSVW